MNEKLMKKFKAEDPNFYDNIVWKEAESIPFDRATSQSRKSGHVLKKVPAFVTTFKQNDNSWLWDELDDEKTMPPATVDAEGRLKDACTRTLAAIELGMTVPTYCPPGCESWTEEDWRVYQGQANNHNICTPNTDEDVVFHIESNKKYLEKNIVGSLFPADKGKEILKDWTDKLHKYLTANEDSSPFYKFPKDKEWFERKIKKVYVAALEEEEDGSGIPYHNPTDKEAIKEYKAATGWRGSGVGIGKSSEDIVLRICKGKKRFMPNMIGYAMWNQLNHENIQTDMVFWDDDVLGATPIDILENCTQVYEDFNLAKTNGISSFRNLYRMPQIKSGKYFDGTDLILMDEEWYEETKKIITNSRTVQKTGVSEDKKEQKQLSLVV